MENMDQFHRAWLGILAGKLEQCQGLTVQCGATNVTSYVWMKAFPKNTSSCGKFQNPKFHLYWFSKRGVCHRLFKFLRVACEGGEPWTHSALHSGRIFHKFTPSWFSLLAGAKMLSLFGCKWIFFFKAYNPNLLVLMTLIIDLQSMDQTYKCSCVKFFLQKMSQKDPYRELCHEYSGINPMRSKDP